MKIAIAGSSGTIGTALAKSLTDQGHTVVRLIRSNRAEVTEGAAWNPLTGELDVTKANGTECVVYLGGAPVGERRWTRERKKILYDSRVGATRRLVESLSRLSPAPRVFISASAVGYFGSRGDELLSEDSPPGVSFLANLIRDWEDAAFVATQHGMRTVVLRFGVVLTPKTGALAQLLGQARRGSVLGMGSGKQWISWSTLSEAVRIINHAIHAPEWNGIINAVTPNPVTNAEFMDVIARFVGRRTRTRLAVPGFLLRLLIGEVADAYLLTSQRVEPRKLLQQLHYKFADPRFEEWLQLQRNYQ